jgi:hypothetical protein
MDTATFRKMRTWQAKVQPHILRVLGETLAHELADTTIVADNTDAKTVTRR